MSKVPSLGDMKCQCFSSCCKGQIKINDTPSSSTPMPNLLCCIKIWKVKRKPIFRRRKLNT